MSARATPVAAVAALVAAAANAAPAAPAGEALAWDQAFAAPADAPDLHLVARYRGGDGAWHRLEAWRRGDTFVHRRTDDRVDLFVMRDERAAGGARYQVRDVRRGPLIEVDRANLFRIGVFSDWSSLAHLLRAPAGAARVTRLAQATDGATAPTSGCDWFRVEAAAPASAQEVCWSTRWAVPLRVQAVDAAGRVEPLLEVLDAATPALTAAGEPQDDGFRPPVLPASESFVDANADIDPSTD